MKLFFLISIFTCTALSFGQVSGNMNYQERNHWKSSNVSSYSNIDFPTNNDMLIEAKGLANVKADAFVAIFSVVQVGKTSEEATQLMNQRLAPALQSLKAKNFETFVDMVSFVPMYEYEVDKKIFSKRTYNELPIGFELKQNLHIKFTEASQLNDLVALLSNNEIYDLVRMDYYATQLESVKKELKEKVKVAFSEKLKSYETTLGESFASTDKKVVDGFVITSPAEQYKTYEAYNSAQIQGKRLANIVQANKSVTQYYQPIANSNFEVVINPIIVEPVIQVIYGIKMSVNHPNKNKEYLLVTPNGDLKKLPLNP